MSYRRAPLALLCLVLLTVAGCSDSSEPAVGGGDGEGTIDPGAGTFVLESLKCELPGDGFCTVDLIGSDLVLDDDGEHVELTVALHNAGRSSLYEPVIAWAFDFDPITAWPVNSDAPIRATDPSVGPAPGLAGWIYDDELGADRVLDPGETSDGRRWRFRTEDQDPFSFDMRVDAGPLPEEPSISGVCFWDENRNGVRDAGEGPFGLGHVTVTDPAGDDHFVRVDGNGHYRYPLDGIGLHAVAYHIDAMTIVPIAFSTPNPRQVLVTPGPDGLPRGFHEAHFGAYTDLPPVTPPIMFSDLSPDSLHAVPWDYISAVVTEDDRMGFEVGYSGCDPRHHFTLWMSGGIMESLPPQATVVLVHHFAESCGTYFEEEYLFDLRPLADRYLQGFGPGVLVLNVHDFAGDVHQVEWFIDEVWPAN